MAEVVDGVDALRRAARERLRSGAHAIKIMASGGVISPSDPLRVPQYSTEEIRVVAEEAVRWFGVSRGRIEIVPNGVDDFFAPDGDEEDYVLFVGTIEPRKGLDDLLAVWDSLPAPRPRLILCGDAGWGNVALPAGAEVTGYVDRERFAAAVESRIASHPRITLHRDEVTEIPRDRPVIVACGPLPGDALLQDIDAILRAAQDDTLNFEEKQVLRLRLRMTIFLLRS